MSPLASIYCLTSALQCTSIPIFQSWETEEPERLHNKLVSTRAQVGVPAWPLKDYLCRACDKARYSLVSLIGCLHWMRKD